MVRFCMAVLAASSLLSFHTATANEKLSLTKHQSVEVINVLPIPVPIIQFVGGNAYLLATLLFLVRERHIIGLNTPTLYRAVLYALGAFGVKSYCKYLLADRGSAAIEPDADSALMSSVTHTINEAIAYVKASIDKN